MILDPEAYTHYTALFISAVACALSIQLRLSLDLHVTILRPPIFSDRHSHVNMTVGPTNRSLEKRDMCANVYMPGLALIFLLQIKACKERWDARCTRGALKWRCAAAQDQIKMKITQFGLILWDGSSGPVKRCSSIDTQAELHPRRLCGTAVCSGTQCG